MQIRHKCWNCSRKFLAGVVIPAKIDVTCPRCGMGVREWIPTPHQKVIGMKYNLLASSKVGRIGRERQQLWEQSGKVTRNKHTFAYEDITRGITRL